MKSVRLLLLLGCFLLSFSIVSQINAQPAWDNQTRALYILDISKYVKFDEDRQSHVDFNIGVLGTDADFYWDLFDMAKSRKLIQNKPIKVLQFADLDKIEQAHVIFVHKKDGFKMKSVLDRVEGKNTLVISEGYDFHESMINFVVVDSTPEFEVNEELMNKAGLHVSQLFLAHAIKTREDWEELFNVTEVALEETQDTVVQQKVLIDSQLVQIAEQEELIHEQLKKLEELNTEIEEKQKTLQQKTVILNRQVSEINQQKTLIIQQTREVKAQKDTLQKQEGDINKQLAEIETQQDKIAAQDSVLVEQLKAIEKQKMLIWFFIIALLLVSGLGYFIYRGYKIKKQANIQLEAKNKQISAQKDEIQQQKELAESQRDHIAYQKQHITDSITYALRIQTALLPSLELFTDKLDHFVLYKPRDIVSGDFYWVAEVDEKQIIIAADCTGHGVPGAFMSMLGVSFLNEIVINRGITQPDETLNHLRKDVIKSLKQMEEASDVKDGMDMCVCLLDVQKKSLQFAGANNPLYILSDNELNEIKGDKMPVAVHERMDPYTNHWIDLKKGDTFYIFSDGYPDQFGGPNQKKFLSKNFKQALIGLQDMSMIKQGAELDKIFEEWRKEVEQIDDVTVIGVRI